MNPDKSPKKSSPPQYARLTREMICDRRLKGIHLKILGNLDLRGFTLEQGAWPSRKTMSVEMGYSIPQISRGIQDLKQWGFIIVQRRDLDPHNRRSNVYRANALCGTGYFFKRFKKALPVVSQDRLLPFVRSLSRARFHEKEAKQKQISRFKSFMQFYKQLSIIRRTFLLRQDKLNYKILMEESEILAHEYLGFRHEIKQKRQLLNDPPSSKKLFSDLRRTLGNYKAGVVSLESLQKRVNIHVMEYLGSTFSHSEKLRLFK